VRLFLALMFLSSGNKIVLSQEEEFKDFSINLR
jgi:chromatin segregation and condensation protein Rec8/ScpA/Scc1 (kleisin family)